VFLAVTIDYQHIPTDYVSEGWEFESLRAHHFNQNLKDFIILKAGKFSGLKVIFYN